MVDLNVPFHFVPCYSKPVIVCGKEFIDVDFPLKAGLNTIEVAQEIKRRWSISVESAVYKLGLG